MSDEALDAHLQWLDDCARAQVVDYETWLEGRVALLEVDLAKTTRAMQAAIDAGGMAMSENQRLTKIVEDYEEEIETLKREKEELWKTIRITADELEGHVDEENPEVNLGGCLDGLRNALLTAEEQEDEVLD